VYSKFLGLSKDKQNKIINAALKVFSKTTYKKASTDDIVVEAEISKGSLFHYFKNKKNLYLYLYNYTTDVMLKEYYTKVDLEERDIFERLKNLVTIKMELLSKYPDVFNFLVSAMQEDDYNLKDNIQSKNEDMIAKNFKLLLSNIDKGRFRDDIDADTAIEMIMLTFDGYANSELLKMKVTGFNQNLSDKWLDDFDKYIKTMKKIYYKGV
jgi:AcrR family transcriptional regulator